MSWRTLERELADILNREGLTIEDEGGDHVVTDRGLIVFSITELAKELMRRGIGQGTPR